MRLRRAELLAVRTDSRVSSHRMPPALTGVVLAMASACLPMTSACAQAAAGFTLVPSLQLRETLTNNVDLSPTDQRSDLITQVTAGIALGIRSGGTQGFLNYGLTRNFYARDTSRSSVSNQNSLAAIFDTELIERRASVGVSASMGQTAVSAFGAQPGLSGLPSSNVTEYRTFSLTPKLRGYFGPAVEYTAGLGYSISNASGTSAGDSTSATAFLHLGPSSPGVIGWAVDFSALQTDYAAGRGVTVDNRLMGTLSRRIDALDLLVNASAGAEATDLASFEKARYWNYGLGATWSPSPRTLLLAQLDERFFGRAHVLRLEHRTALTTWTLSDTRSLNSSGNGITAVGRGATFDLYFTQFAAVEPDLTQRTDLVHNYLKANGLSASSGTVTGFLRSGETVVRGQSVSVAYRGLRGAAVLAINRSVTVPIEGAPPPSADFVGSANVVSDNLSMNLSHRLTPASSVNLTLSYQQSHGDRPEQYINQREIRLQYVIELTDRGNLTGGARRALYKNYQASYNESAAFAAYGYRF